MVSSYSTIIIDNEEADLEHLKANNKLFPRVKNYLLPPVNLCFSEKTHVLLGLFCSHLAFLAKLGVWNPLLYVPQGFSHCFQYTNMLLLLCQVSTTLAMTFLQVVFGNRKYLSELLCHIFEEILSLLPHLLLCGKKQTFLNASVTTSNRVCRWAGNGAFLLKQWRDKMKRQKASLWDFPPPLIFSFVCVDVKVAWNKDVVNVWGELKERNTKKIVLCVLESLQGWRRNRPHNLRQITWIILQLLKSICLFFLFFFTFVY